MSAGRPDVPDCAGEVAFEPTGVAPHLDGPVEAVAVEVLPVGGLEWSLVGGGQDVLGVHRVVLQADDGVLDRFAEDVLGVIQDVLIDGVRAGDED